MNNDCETFSNAPLAHICKLLHLKVISISLKY